MNFVELLRGKKSAADYQVAIAETIELRDTARAELQGLQDERGRVLLEGSDGDISKFETEMKDKTLIVERLGLAVDELNRRHGEAVEKESRAALDREFARAKKAQARGVELIKGYSPGRW